MRDKRFPHDPSDILRLHVEDFLIHEFGAVLGWPNTLIWSKMKNAWRNGTQISSIKLIVVKTRSTRGISTRYVPNYAASDCPSFSGFDWHFHDRALRLRSPSKCIVKLELLSDTLGNILSMSPVVLLDHWRNDLFWLSWLLVLSADLFPVAICRRLGVFSGACYRGFTMPFAIGLSFVFCLDNYPSWRIPTRIAGTSVLDVGRVTRRLQTRRFQA